jgi:small subunit ribosomal protein S9
MAEKKAKKVSPKTEAPVEEVKEVVQEKTEPTVSYYEGIGRRRESTARVRLYVVSEAPITVRGHQVKKGDMTVNGKSVETYFPGEVMKKSYMEPLRTTNTIGRFAITVTTSGGGLNGQLGSVVLGMSRALTKVDPEKFRPILKKRGFLTRDSRIRQRRKAGFAGKSRAKKQSPKR